jgi:hypothetical protein
MNPIGFTKLIGEAWNKARAFSISLFGNREADGQTEVDSTGVRHDTSKVGYVILGSKHDSEPHPFRPRIFLNLRRQHPFTSVTHFAQAASENGKQWASR